jgi:hypothetical protein
LKEVYRLRVFFQNRVLRRIFGPKRKEDDELHSLYSSPNTVRVIKTRRMRWAGHVVHMERGDVFTGFWLGGPRVRNY